MHRVVVADKVDEGGLALLTKSEGIEVVKTIKDKKRLLEALPTAHALLVRSETKVTAELLAQASELRVIGRAGIGVDNIDLEAATQRGIAVLNTPGGNTISAAEHTVGLLLALVRRIPWADQSMRAGAWDRPKFQGVELSGKTLGVVGLGRIGAHVATIARAFGMLVVAHDPFLTEARALELQVQLLPLDDVLKRADVVTLHLPLTDETLNLIDRRRLGLMKKTGVLINAARGGLVDEVALAEALKAEKLGGAAIDVFETEPLPADSPLRQADRVILTPHLAAATAEAQERVGLEICRLVRDALLKGDLSGAVNVPGIPGAALARLRPLLSLSRRLGRLAAAISPGRVREIDVQYGGPDDAAPKPVMLAALEGVLGAMGVGPVTLVNAMALAEGRGITVGRRVGSPALRFEATVGVTVRADGNETTVVGAMVGDRFARVIRIDEYPVDIPADGSIVLLRNRDEPGVMGRVGTVLGDAGVHIGSYQQARPAPGNGEAFAAVAVDHTPPQAVVDRLRHLPGVLEVRVAVLDDAG
ncbi:MAG: phosphoglycerate dehydrogenase [Gemmatimonadetes bacterium]|nr:phosphoglycerate dehydrogenase [Gemmatimonadota bacterium]